MRAAIQRLVQDLTDTTVPLRSDIALQDARLVVADSVMCALLAGGTQTIGAADAQGVRHWSGAGHHAVRAVECNAIQAHARELDPVHFVTRGHPGVVIAPAISALVDLDVLPRHDALDTFALATEVMAFLGQAWGPGLAAQGTHATAFLGPMAAVAAVGQVCRWSPAQVESALFAAVALGAGSTAAFGTSLKQIQVGRAAGLIVDLVTRPPLDSVGSRWIEEMERRFGPPQDDWITEDAPRLGAELVVEQVPSMLKLLPACAFFVSALDHLLDAVHARADDDLVELVLDVPREAVAVDRGQMPRHPDEVPFSLAYLIACVWVAGGVGDFRTPRWLTDPAVAALVPRIRIREIPGRFDFLDTRLEGELRVCTSASRQIRPVTYLARPRRYNAADLARKWASIGESHDGPPAAALDALLVDLADPGGDSAGGWFPCFYNLHDSHPRKDRHAQDHPR